MKRILLFLILLLLGPVPRQCHDKVQSLRAPCSNLTILFHRRLSKVFGLSVAQAQEADLATAQKQYKKYCAKCHGPTGHGDGEQGATLKKKPQVFTDCAEMAKDDDEKLFHTIKVGGEPVDGHKSEMPAMGKSLEDNEIRGLVAYVRSFCRQ